MNTDRPGPGQAGIRPRPELGTVLGFMITRPIATKMGVGRVCLSTAEDGDGGDSISIPQISP